MNNYKEEVKVIYDVMSEKWLSLHELTKTNNKYITSLGQDECRSEYVRVCFQIDYNTNGIDISLNGNPNDPREINRLSYKELISMYQTTNLDFYETARQFREEKLESCKDKLEYQIEAKAFIQNFAKGFVDLERPTKKRIHSKKSSQQYVQYEGDKLKAFEEDLKKKGLLSLNR